MKTEHVCIIECKTKELLNIIADQPCGPHENIKITLIADLVVLKLK